MPLNETGRQQAAALARRLAGEEVHAIYASDLRRAWETAAIIGAACGQPVHPEPRLREIDFGAWEGLRYDEIQAQYAQHLAAWLDDPMNIAIPDGGTLADIVTRIKSLLSEVTSTHPEETVLLVAHGGSLQVLLSLALGLAPQARWQFRLDAGSLSELYLSDKGTVLARLNDTCHLSARRIASEL